MVFVELHAGTIARGSATRSSQLLYEPPASPTNTATLYCDAEQLEAYPSGSNDQLDHPDASALLV